MLRVAVLDDNVSEAQELARMLDGAASCPAGGIAVSTFDSSHRLEGAIALVEEPFSVLYLDIRLAGSQADDAFADGIDLASRLARSGSRAQVVFMSGYDEYHTAVYGAPHVAYLKKPFRQADVDLSLKLALEAIERDALRPIVFHMRGSERIVDPGDISYLESDLRLVRVHLRRGDSFEVYGKLAALLKELPPRFIRCHQSFVINLDCVEELGTTDARLVGNVTVPVSRRHRFSVREALFQHIRTKVDMR